MIKFTWIVFGILLSVVSFFPLINSKYWLFRIFDFIRVQLVILILLLLLTAPFLLAFDSLLAFIVPSILLASLSYHLAIIIPYIPRKLSRTAKLKSEIVAISVNVKQDNDQFSRLIEIIDQVQPDILLTMETDQHWEYNLQAIERNYKNVIRVPKDNKYGMHLYTKLNLKRHRVHYLISNEHPAIEATLEWNNQEFIFWGIHPPPPSPTEKPTSKQKDAELLKVARILSKTKLPTIITGDFNNVTWSKTSKLFGKISNLKDARKKKGLFPTFPAHFLILGFPIDLLFHSNSITIGSLKTIHSIGSDHLPLQFSFALNEKKEPRKQLSNQMNNRIDETIEEGKQAAKVENR